MKDQSSSIYHVSENDARRYARSSNAIVLALFAGYAALLLGLISPWLLVALTGLLPPHWMIYVHESFHVRKAEATDWLNRLLPLPFTPLALGYHEFREIHLGHHRHTATPEDPDAFHLLGGPLRAFWGALTLPEQAFIRHVRQHGMNRQLGREAMIRFGIFTISAGLGGWTFLWFWVPLRVSYALGDFVFFHMLHERQGQAGTYPLPLPRWAERVARLVLGRTLLGAIMHHNVHHRDARIAAHHLATVASSLPDRHSPGRDRAA